MFSLMLQKLNNKKKMTFCLLIGNVLLMAVAVSHPMYRVSSFQKMLTGEFKTYREEQGQWPAGFGVVYTSMKGITKTGFSSVDEAADKAAEKLGAEVLQKITVMNLGSRRGEAETVRDGEKEKRIGLAAATGFEEHVQLLYGTFPDSSVTDGIVEVMVSDETMVEEDILLEDEYVFTEVPLADGTSLHIRVVGVFRPVREEPGDRLYWEALDASVSNQLILAEPVFRELFTKEPGSCSMSGTCHYFFDYEKIEITQVSHLLSTLKSFGQDAFLEDKLSDYGFLQVLDTYVGKANRIETTLLILQVPVLLLLCAFLYMISGQLLQMEQNEIALLQSRGAARKQIFSLYLMQSVFLGVVSLAFGIPLGALFCKLLGSATAFLQFSFSDSLPVRFTPDILLYGAGAFLVSVWMTMIPLISYSRLSIVNLKQSNSRQKKSLWKKIYLDIILLAVSLYGFYSFQRSSTQMMEDVLSGRALDPLLYVSFSLFVLGGGLFLVRLQPLLLRFFFFLFKNKMKPAAYASFIGSIRTEKRQEFIILFMIITVSVGISNAAIVRTILSNAVRNTEHLAGADIALKEKWDNNKFLVMKDPSIPLKYYEPDFSRYEVIPGVETATRVVYGEVSLKESAESSKISLMGIRPAGFWKVTRMEPGLLPYTYAEYLNVLAVRSQAVVVSENFMLKKNYKLGDMIVYRNTDGKTAVGYIYGFFPYWPSYAPVSYALGEGGTVQSLDEYLIVANLSYLEEQWGAYPYEIWMDVSDGGEGLYEWLETQDSIKLLSLKDMEKQKEAILQDAMFQGTNGILSMSFIVILLLCCAGYLIYWIMSIHSRELLFGVLRAMGMRKKEIVWMLVVEQFCSGIYAVAAGSGIGMAASKMFVPMLQKAYAGSEQVLPLQLIIKVQDMIQLYTVIGVMLCVCFVVLGRLVSGMNIGSALKLGED